METSYTRVPLTGGVPSALCDGTDRPQRDVVPGWSTEVEPYRLEANACYRAWLAAGKPCQGELQNAKLQSHAQFRYAVRRVKLASKLHQARGLFSATMSGDIELMKEMKRLKKGNGPMEELAETVDGITMEHEVADKFKEVYEALYNSLPSEDEMTALKVNILELIQTEASESEIAKLTSSVVKEAA